MSCHHKANASVTTTVANQAQRCSPHRPKPTAKWFQVHGDASLTHSDAARSVVWMAFSRMRRGARKTHPPGELCRAGWMMSPGPLAAIDTLQCWTRSAGSSSAWVPRVAVQLFRTLPGTPARQVLAPYEGKHRTVGSGTVQTPSATLQGEAPFRTAAAHGGFASKGARLDSEWLRRQTERRRRLWL